MKFFTREWWYFDSLRDDFDNDAYFKKYNSEIRRLADIGVPIQEKLTNPCRLHDHEITRMSLDKKSLVIVLRNPDKWNPFVLEFIRPELIICTKHNDGERYEYCDLANIVGAGVGYSEYEALPGDMYCFTMIFDRDFSIRIELRERILFRAVSNAQADDDEIPERAETDRSNDD